MKDAPNYIPGIIATLAILGFDAVIAAVSVVFLHRLNKKADRGEIIIEESPEFRYTL